MRAPRIIINADDFGLHPSVNEAIEGAHKFGIVTSASIMVLGDAVDDAVDRSRRNPTLDLGLHFCLIGIRGFPSSLPRFALRLLTGRMSAHFIADALRRQLDLALERNHLALSHIDSHQHLHALPHVMRVVAEVAREYGIRAVRLPLDQRTPAALSPGRKVQVTLLSSMARLSRPIINASLLRTTDHFRGMAESGHLSSKILCRFLRTASPGAVTEIVCHPGRDNAALARLYGWHYDWEGEYEALCDPTVRATASNSQIRFTTWRDVFAE